MFDFKLNNKKTVIIGLGNNYRQDDSIGLYIVKNIKKRENFLVISNENSLIEDYIEEVINFKPEIIIIFDVADFNGFPGEIRKFKITDLINLKTFSTHIIPINIILDYIKTSLPEVDIVIYAIQPQNIDYGTEVNIDVLNSANEIIKKINDL